MDPLHPLLRAQLERHHVPVDSAPEPWRQLLADVNAAYLAADRHLLEEQRLLESLTDGFAGLFWVTDEAGRLTRWNRHLESLTGLPTDRLRASEWITLVRPEDRRMAADALRRIRQGETLAFECGIVNRAGSPVPHRFVGRAIVLDDRLAILGAGFDVTDRKRAADALAFSQERFALAMDAANDGLWDWHIPTDKGYFSPRYCTMLGYQPEELTPGHSFWTSLLHPEDRNATERRFLDYLRGARETYEAEFRMLARDNSWVWILSRGRIIERDADGHPVRVMGTHSDITDRKRAEQRLRESEERLRLTLEATNVGLYDLDLRTGEAVVNDQYALMLGFDPASFRENNAAWRERMHPEDQPRVHGTFNDYVAGHLPDYRVEFRSRTADGSWRWILSIGKIVSRDAEGSPLRMLGTHIDITDRKKIEEHMARVNDELEARVAARTRELADAKRAAEAASESKSRFLAMMSHEIRTPLNGVTGVLHLLGRENLTPQQRHWIGIASTSSNALLHVINDILDFSKVEAGKLDLHPVAIDLHGTIRETAETFVSKITSRGLEWRLRIDPSVPPAVEADPHRLAQILGNLLSNAVKFTETGSVQLEVSTLPVAPRPPGSRTTNTTRIRFVVADTGPGIGAADQARLFKPFSQVDNSATRRHGGTGLGLGICRHLVRLMGGDIGLESEPGKGTEFWFEIPFRIAALPVPPESPPASVPALPPTPLPAAPDPSPAQTPRACVLVAEDNEINQELAREMVCFAGCECDCVSDGHAAIAAAVSGRYALVFMDWHMPGLNGHDATQRIREIEQTRHRPGQDNPHIVIVAMTANAMAGDREACLAAGMDDYLSKPLDPDEVIRVLDRWIPGKAAPR